MDWNLIFEFFNKFYPVPLTIAALLAIYNILIKWTYSPFFYEMYRHCPKGGSPNIRFKITNITENSLLTDIIVTPIIKYQPQKPINDTIELTYNVPYEKNHYSKYFKI